MATSDSFSEFVLDQLEGLGRVECVRMFGGQGLYRDGVFFAVLYLGRLYFKVDDVSRAEYERRGMEPFKPSEKQALSTYYEVPVEVLEDRDALVEWAERAVRAQVEAGKKGKGKGRRGKGKMDNGKPG